MFSDKQQTFSDLLIGWYKQNGRELPWRTTKAPYAIWLSEVILQQTRVQQGLSYYLLFLERYPTLTDVAAAPIDDVLKLWQGLGYYTRARNLHSTAQFIQSAYKGSFPADYKSIRNLKGIGDYTAAAIASICFGEAYPVLDGNVFRVMSRYLCLDEPVNSTQGKKIVMSALTNQIDHDQPGDFNQAMMEVGALICTPKNPDCQKCPLQQHCQAYNQNKVEQYPVSALKKEARTRYFSFLVLEEDKDGLLYTYIDKREGGDIWEGLYEFPLVETAKALNPGNLLKNPVVKGLLDGLEPKLVASSPVIRHILSHQILYARFYTLRTNNISATKWLQSRVRVSWNDIHQYPVSRLTEKFLASHE